MFLHERCGPVLGPTLSLVVPVRRRMSAPSFLRNHGTSKVYAIRGCFIRAAPERNDRSERSDASLIYTELLRRNKTESCVEVTETDLCVRRRAPAGLLWFRTKRSYIMQHRAPYVMQHRAQQNYGRACEVVRFGKMQISKSY